MQLQVIQTTGTASRCNESVPIDHVHVLFSSGVATMFLDIPAESKVGLYKTKSVSLGKITCIIIWTRSLRWWNLAWHITCHITAIFPVCHIGNFQCQFAYASFYPKRDEIFCPHFANVIIDIQISGLFKLRRVLHNMGILFSSQHSIQH